MSFLRRQVMDYKEQMKQANENNAFMIHNGCLLYTSSGSAWLYYLWRDCGTCGSKCIGCEKSVAGGSIGRRGGDP